MAKRRLNDTKALAAEASGGTSHSVRTEKISNGWLTHRTSDAGGDYCCETTFSEREPKISVPRVTNPHGVTPQEGGSLRGAMGYLKGGE